MVTDLMGNVYQYLYEATGSDLAPVAFYAVVLVLLGFGVGSLAMMVLRKLRPTETAEAHE